MKVCFLIAILFSIVCHCYAQEVPDSSTSEKVFTITEIEAEFPGGIKEWKKFVEKNVNADVATRNRARRGTYKVIVRFIIDTDGSISDVEAETNYGHGMEAEVVRVISSGPKWTPAMQDGKKVKAYHRQPITFVVQ